MAAKSKSKPSAAFFRLERRLVQSPGHRALSFTARVVLQELMVQYNGKNNGDLSATRTMAKEWGIGSPTTIGKVLEELQDAGWIVKTRDGSMVRRRCDLYALAWLPIDECPDKDLEIGPTRWPMRPLPELLNSISSGT